LQSRELELFASEVAGAREVANATRIFDEVALMKNA
jgi:hypothetical protein